MRIDSILGSDRKRNSVYAVLALGFFLASCGIRIGQDFANNLDHRGQDDSREGKTGLCNLPPRPMQLTRDAVSPQAPSGPYPATILKVCSGDTFNGSGYSNGNSHELVVFVSDQILQDRSGNVQATFPASKMEALRRKGIVTSNTTLQNADHEWYVMLFDKQSGEVHYDDPKILIGR